MTWCLAHSRHLINACWIKERRSEKTDIDVLFTRPTWLSQLMVTVREPGDAAWKVLQLVGVFQIGQKIERSREHRGDKGMNPGPSK